MKSKNRILLTASANLFKVNRAKTFSYWAYVTLTRSPVARQSRTLFFLQEPRATAETTRITWVPRGNSAKCSKSKKNKIWIYWSFNLSNIRSRMHRVQKIIRTVTITTIGCKKPVSLVVQRRTRRASLRASKKTSASSTKPRTRLLRKTNLIWT